MLEVLIVDSYHRLFPLAKSHSSDLKPYASPGLSECERRKTPQAPKKALKPQNSPKEEDQRLGAAREPRLPGRPSLLETLQAEAKSELSEGAPHPARHPLFLQARSLKYLVIRITALSSKTPQGPRVRVQAPRVFGSGVSSVWEFQKTLIILFFSRQVMMLSCIPRLCSSHCILGRRHGLGQRKCYCASDPFWILEPLMSSDGPQQKPFASGCSLCSVGCAGFGVSGQAGRAHSEAHAGGNLRIRGDIIHWPSRVKC